MFSLKKFTNIKKLKSVWLELQSQNQNLDVMAEFDFVKTYTSGFTNQIKKLVSKNKPIYFLVLEDEKPLLIFSAVNSQDTIKSLYTLDFYDLVTAENLSSEKLLSALKFVAGQENKNLEFKNLKEERNGYQKLNSLVNFEDGCKCVKICYTQNYDNYYNSLSKHSRQNLRTAYNRLKTDNMELAVNFTFGKTKKKLACKLKNIYLTRRQKKYENMSFLKKVLYTIDEPISNVCFNLKNSFSSTIYINNKPAGFMAGLIKNGEAIVPRLAIDDNFSRYSVGVVLVNETIKELIKNNIFTLDLATGAEAYKTQMGGGRIQH